MFKALKIFFLVRSAIVFQGRSLLLKALYERHCCGRLRIKKRSVGERTIYEKASK